MPKFSTGQNPPFGLEPVTIDFLGSPRGGAAAVGEVWQLDIGQSDADVTNFQVGSPTGAFSNLIASAAAGVESGIFAVALEAIPDNGVGKWRLCGIVDVLVQKNSGNIAAGDVLVSTAAQKYLDADVTAGARHLGKALETVTGPSTAALAKVWFDGADGFGVHVS